MRRREVHEVSIALGMVDELVRIAVENNARQVTAVSLRIGRSSGIVTDSLKFAFDSVKLDDPLISSAELLIEDIPLRYECSNCDRSFEMETMLFPSCPDCGSYSLKLLSGDEMDIAHMELEV
jgi:hydrogenase nickel incorporation protein HypA/HybF